MGPMRYNVAVSVVTENHETDWLTTRAIAAELGVNVGTVRRWIREDLLPARRGTPGRRFVHRDDLDAFLDKWGHTGPE